MKKIIISLSIIAAVAAVAIGATKAFFSDTETSSGNTFTAGAIDLKVDNECEYNGYKCSCDSNGCKWEGGPYDGQPCQCTWGIKDLTNNDLFVNFSDLKPGDWGEDTISFHVGSNDAWLCCNVRVTEDSDVDCTEPEMESGDPECSQGKVGGGELDNYLEVFAWIDGCNDGDEHRPGDNIFTIDCKGDVPLMKGPEAVPLTQYIGTSTIADSTFSIAGEDASGHPLPLSGGEKTYYIGKVWCFGDMYIDNNGNISCSGLNVGNDAQTDKLKLDISFTAVQARNNPDFKCE